MNWIKIKDQHMSSEYTFYEVGILVKYQLLVARLERHPTKKEIEHELPLKRYQMLSKKVVNVSQIDMKSIANKVLEDVESVAIRKQLGKERQRKFKAKQKSNASPKREANEAEKRR